MTAREQIEALADRYPWAMMSGTHPDEVRLYRWCRCGPSEQHRHEFVVFFDAIGRITCWSEWRNYRSNIDGEPGQRSRLMSRLKDYS